MILVFIAYLYLMAGIGFWWSDIRAELRYLSCTPTALVVLGVLAFAVVVWLPLAVLIIVLRATATNHSSNTPGPRSRT